MTKRIKFTQAAVDNLAAPPAGRVTVWDASTPGFGLRLAAPRPGSRAGRKTYVAMGRVDGRAVMATIGTTAQIPNVAEARSLARAAFSKMKGGTRPIEERRADRARRAAEAAQAEAKAIEDEEGRFAVVASAFLAEARDKKGKRWSPRYAYEVRRIFARDVLPVWGDRPIRGITKDDVAKLLAAKASRRGRARKGAEGGAWVQANRTLTRLRSFFAWAAAKGLVDSDPTAGIGTYGYEVARDRVLDEAEIVAFWRAADRAGWPFEPIFKLLLLTAQRLSQVAGMRWSEIDPDKAVWTIPAERMKGGRSHIVHLSEAAIKIIAALPRQAGPLVFPTRTGRPIGNFGKAKDRLDAAIAHEAEVPAWVLHDLRRSACTIMAEQLKVAPHVADKILAHSTGTIKGVAAIYNRAAYLDERRAALEALGRFVEARVRPAVGKVVDLRQRAAVV